MALATLSIDLIAKIAQFERDMGKAARASQDSADKITKAMGIAGAAIAGLGAGIGIAGILNFTKATIDSIDALNDLRDATGASIENISALEDVAARTGTGFDTVQASLIKFNNALADAKPGSGAEAALDAIGLKAKELREIDPAEALRITAVALAGFADDGNKARLSQQLFGKSLKEVAPFLKDLSEQGTLVATVTTEQAQAAEDFNKQLFALEKNAKDASRTLLKDFVPALNEVLNIYGGKGLSAALDSIGNKLFDWEGSQQRKVIRNIKDDLDQLTGASSKITLDVFGIKGDLAKQIDAKTQELAAAQAKYFKLANGNAGRGSLNPDSVDARSSVVVPDADKGKGGKAEPSKLTDAQTALASYVKSLEGQLTTLEKLSEEQKALNFLQSIGTTGQIPQVRELVLGMAGEVQILKEMADAQKMVDRSREQSSKYFESLEREAQAQEEANKSMRLHIEEIGLTKEAVTALEVARIDNAIAIEEGNAALLRGQSGQEQEIAAIERTIELLSEKKRLTQTGAIVQAAADSKAETDRTSKEFADTLHNDLKGAFGAAFRDSKDPLGAFGDALQNVIYSRAATALADSFANAASNSAGSAGLLKTVASIFGFANGGIMSSGGPLKLNAYANGGVASSPQMAIFGEGRMNEAFVPLPDGRSIPVSLQGGGAQGVVINQPITINAPGATAQTVAQIAAMMPGLIASNARVVEGVIKQAMRRNGGRLTA